MRIGRQLWTVIGLYLIAKEEAFESRSIPRRKSLAMRRGLAAGNWIDAIQKFFDDFKNGDDAPHQPVSKSYTDDRIDRDDEAAGTTRIATIPLKHVKPGGLRLFLMLYLMGQQNTPAAGSWQASQPTTDEYVIDFWYHDRTALLSVNLSEEDKRIDLNRVGSMPSNAYLMQESVIVEGLLDELENIESATDVNEKDRLLLLHEPKDAIMRAKDELSFG